MGERFQRTLKLSMSFSQKHFLISLAISGQVTSVPLNWSCEHKNFVYSGRVSAQIYKEETFALH